MDDLTPRMAVKPFKYFARVRYHAENRVKITATDGVNPQSDKPKCSFYITLIVIVLLSLLQIGASTSTPTALNLLSEYQKILQNTGQLRSFKFSAGAPKYLHQFRNSFDSKGYMWCMDSENVYRFNGIEFTNMLDTYLPSVSDTLFNVVPSFDDKILVCGRKNLYLWDNYRFQIYPFAKNDRIANVRFGKESLVGIGSKGYAFLGVNGDWQYFPNQHMNSELFNGWGASWTPTEGYVKINHTYIDDLHHIFNYNFQITHRLDKSVKFDASSHSLNEDIYVKMYSGSNLDSLRIPLKDEKVSLAQNDILALHFANDPKGKLWAYFRSTNLIYQIDSQKKKVIPHHLPRGYVIQTMFSTGKDQFWVNYINSNDYGIGEFDSIAGKLKETYTIDMKTNQINRYSLFNVHIGDRSNQYNAGYWGSIYKDVPYEVLYLDLNNQTLTKINIGKVFDQQFGTAFKHTPPGASFDNLFAYTEKDPNIENVHNVYTYDVLTGIATKTSIPDNAKSLIIHAYNHEEQSIFVEGFDKHWKIPLNMLSRKLQGFDNASNASQFHVLECALGNFIVHEHTPENSIFRETKIYKYESDKSEGVKLAGTIPKASYVFFDKQNALCYLLQERDGKQALVRYNLRMAETTFVKYLAPNSRVFPYFDSLITLNHDNYEIISADNHHKEAEKSNLIALKKTLAPLLEPYGISIENIFFRLELTPIAKDQFFSNAITFRISKAGDSYSVFDGGTFSYDNTSQLVHSKLELSGKDPILLKVPSFVYDLKKDLITFKPDWLAAHNTKTQTYIMHLVSKDPKSKVLSLNPYHNPSIESNRQDFSFASGEVIPQIKLFSSEDDIYALLSTKSSYDRNSNIWYGDGSMHYRYQDKWQKLSLQELGTPSTLLSMVQKDEMLYFCFANGLVKYSLNHRIAFPLARESLPEWNTKLYTVNGSQLLLLGDNAIYRIGNPYLNMRLNIDHIAVGKEFFSPQKALRLAHDQNSINIPIDILNVILPESCKIKHRLEGYDKEWILHLYLDQITYQNLPPGKYQFEIMAFTPDGDASEMQRFSILISAPWYLRWFAIVLYVLLLILAFWLIYKIRPKRLVQRTILLEQQVSLRTQELSNKTEQLEQNSIELMDRQQKIQESIDYASLIQKSILPQKDSLAEVLKDSFVIWYPRDVVGGDFYWMYHNESYQEVLMACIDCTGHGVPGALISMTVCNLLDHIVRDQKIFSPSKILVALHLGISTAFHQEQENTQQDGVAISILNIQLHKQQLLFSAAAQSMIMFHSDKQLTKQYTGSKHDVGGLKRSATHESADQTIPYTPGSICYLFTDGITDQPQAVGGKLRRLGNGKWVEFVSGIASLPLSSQDEMVRSFLDNLLSHYEQRDDITIIGILL